MDESSVIAQASQGNLEAFNRLAITYQDIVFRQACWMLGEKQAAEDAAQEAFLLAYQKMNGFRNGSFRSWLLRIVSHLCIDELRRRKRRVIISFERQTNGLEEIENGRWMSDPSISIEATIEQRELQRLVIRALDQIPADFRAAIILVDLQNLDYTEAAQVLRIPVGTVKSRLARGRQRMRQLLQDAGAHQIFFDGPQADSSLPEDETRMDSSLPGSFTASDTSYSRLSGGQAVHPRKSTSKSDARLKV